MWSASTKANLCRADFTTYIKLVWVFKIALIAIARRIEHHNFFTFKNFLTIYFSVLCGGAAEVNHRSCHTHNFFNSGAVVCIKIVKPNLALIWIVGEQLHAMSNGVTCGFVASYHKQNKERTELLSSETLSVYFCCHHHARDVVTWVCLTVFTQCLRVGKDLHTYGDKIFKRRHKLRVANAKDGVGPAENFRLIRLGHAHHVANNLQWHLGCNFFNEVARAASCVFRQQMVNDFFSTNLYLVFNAADLTWTKTFCNDGAKTKMLRVVHIDHGTKELIEFLWQVANVGTLAAAELCSIAADEPNVIVTGQCAIATSGRKW